MQINLKRWALRTRFAIEHIQYAQAEARRKARLMEAKRKTEYEFINHGFECEDYWNGCDKGSFANVYTGNGGSSYEAFQDLLEQLAEIDAELRIPAARRRELRAGGVLFK